MRPLRAVLALQCLHRAAAEWKFHEYAKHDTACAPRYINVGMPKSGSSSVSEFYRCQGMTTAHWHNSPRDAAGLGRGPTVWWPLLQPTQGCGRSRCASIRMTEGVTPGA